MNVAAQEVTTVQATIEPEVLPTSQAMVTTPAQLLAIAVNQNADLDKLEKLMALQERWESNEARKAFNVAVAEFKKNPPDIIKDKENKQYGSKYATLANLVNNGSAALAPYGLTVDWKVDQQGQQIKVTCILKHALGHSEEVSITGMPDESGAKNKLQQIKSTITYLKGETFQCVTGVTARDCPGDNDGNGAGKPAVSEKPRQTYSGRPKDGAWEAQGDESRAWLLKIAEEVGKRMKDPADAQDYLESQNLDADEKVALWTRFDSKTCTALKKAHEVKLQKNREAAK